MTAIPTTRSTDRPLRWVLCADAAVGLLVAAGYLLGTTLYAQLTGLPPAVLRGAAIVLLGYVVALGLAAMLTPLRRRLVVGIIVANAAWVIASLSVLALVPTTPFGAFYVIAQAAIVVGFAVAEYVTLRRVQD